TVNRAHNQPLSGILESLAKRTASIPYHSIPRKRYSEWPPFRRAGKRDMIWIGLRHGTKARMSESRRIGFIGLGHMGTPMAANLVRGGHDLLGYDIAPDKAQRFAQTHGTRTPESLAEVGRHADIVITMLPTGREVRDALVEAQGGALAGNLRRGAVVVDMSSAEPVGTRKLGGDLAQRDIALVDAPVSGGLPRAKAGTLAIMIGGDGAPGA